MKRMSYNYKVIYNWYKSRVNVIPVKAYISKISVRDYTCQAIFEDSSWVSNTIELAEWPTQVLNLVDIKRIKNHMNGARRKLA